MQGPDGDIEGVLQGALQCWIPLGTPRALSLAGCPGPLLTQSCYHG